MRASDIFSYTFLFFFFIWLVSVCVLRFFFIFRRRSPIHHPPGPPALPIIGHIHLLSLPLTKGFQALATRFGPLMHLRIVSSDVVVVSDATMAREMLKNNEMSFVWRPDFGGSDHNIYYGYSFIFAEYGPYWRFMKKLCMTELLSMAQVNRFVDVRKEEMMKLMETMVKSSEAGEACNLGVELMNMTNNSTCRMVMSTRCSANADESKLVRELTKDVEEISGKLVLGEILGPLGKLDLFGHGRQLRNFLMKFDNLIERILAEHEEELNSRKKGKKDVMDILLENYRDENAEMKLNRIHIKSFLLELFMAGTETTSVALQYILAELINDPRVFKKLREEINSVVGSKRLVEESDVPNLPYLQAVVKEGLRLHPPAPLIFRRCGEACKINGYDIVKNERVIFNIYSIMRDPSSWENPNDFVPERLMQVNGAKENDEYSSLDIKGGLNFNLFPFGSGRRGCPGATLALAVLHPVIANLVQCFDFKVKGGEKVNMEESKGFSGMVHPFECYPILRVNPSQTSDDD